MIEIRFHGRGGQGAVVASELLARAAIMDGMKASAFPSFGSERRGAPVMAFCRIDDRPIRIHAGIYEPDYVVVLDAKLIKMVNVLDGIKENGKVLINSPKSPEELELKTDREIFTVDATGIALDMGLGSMAAPIVNTAVIGAFAAICPRVKVENVIESIKQAAPAKKEQNAEAARKAYDSVKGV
jgi:2-oxoacid:acceptor oxidoreductase gamma subunit (pyruvate/2-ketoisovalerate family)